MKYITDPSLKMGCYCCNKAARRSHETDFEIEIVRRSWSITTLGQNITSAKRIEPKYCFNCGRDLNADPTESA